MFKTFLKWAAFPVLATLMLPVGVYLWFDYRFDEQVSDYQARQRAVFAQAKEDVAYLRAHNPFPEKQELQMWSVGASLSKMVPWSHQEPGTAPLYIDAETMDQLDSEQYLSLPNGVWEKYDFAWMAELMDSDHWSMWASGPVLEMRNDSEKMLADVPLISYSHLIAWAKLRLLRSLHDKDEQVAMAEVRHLARLITSHETMVSTLVGLGIWQLVDGFCESQGIPNDKRLPEDIVEVTRRVMFYGLGALNYIAAPEVREYFAAPRPNELGWCASAYESLVITGIFEEAEIEGLTSSSTIRDHILASSECDFVSYVKEIPVLRLDDVGSAEERILMQIPFVKGIVYRILLSVAMLSPDTGYTDQPSDG